jgi:flagellin-like hook-associated protein FlgL
MTIAKTNLVNTFTSYVKDLNSKIKTVKSEIASGQNTLTSEQQATVTSLSATIKSYSTPQASITAAQNTIGVAQKAIASILPIMNQMQQLAAQASNSSIGSADSMNMNFRFQQLFTQIGKLATSAGLNGTNLLSGTAGMNVITGTDKTAASRSFVNSVDIYGMMTTGLLSNIKLDSPSNAQSAMWALNSALAQITSGQASLKATTNRLTAQASKLSGLSNTAQQLIDTLQNIDITKLNTQLTQLQSQQNINYQLISQLDSTAYKNLKLLALTSSS